METTEVKSVTDLENFLQECKDLQVNYECERENDNYTVRIEAGTIRTGEFFSYLDVSARANVSIHLDSELFLETYKNLPKEDRFPESYTNHHPFLKHKNLKDSFMIAYFETCLLKIIKNLGAFGNTKDDYISIVKQAVYSRGRIMGHMFGL